MTVEKVYVPVGRERGVSLYEIKKEIEDAAFMLFDHETGEINKDVEDKLEILGMDKTTKILNCIRFQKNMAANQEIFAKEEKRLKAMKEYFKKRADGMLGYISNMCDREKDAGIGDAAGILKYTKSTKTIVEDPAKLPHSCVVLERKPIAKNIKAELLLEAQLIDAMDEDQKKVYVSKFKGAAHLQVGYSLGIK